MSTGKSKDPKLFDKRNIEVIKKGLVSVRETIAVAESVTAGMLQVALASATDASQFFQGGLTAYNVGQKTLHLDVEPIEALASNCVSKTTTIQMAVNVCARFRSHWGVAVTGYATAVPESSGKIYAWYAIARQGQVIETSRISGVTGTPLGIQLQFVNTILSRLAKIISK
jgi:PncC family amidohydrolase